VHFRSRLQVCRLDQELRKTLVVRSGLGLGLGRTANIIISTGSIDKDFNIVDNSTVGIPFTVAAHIHLPDHVDQAHYTHLIASNFLIIDNLHLAENTMSLDVLNFDYMIIVENYLSVFSDHVNLY